MKEEAPNKSSLANRRNNDGKHLIKRADEFFHKPGGVFLICLLFFGLTVWTFVPVLQTEFQLFDEGTEMLNNPYENTGFSWQNLNWALSSMICSNWYPLTRISHMLDFDMFGANPWGHHLTNVLIHAANGILLFLVLKRMTGALWRSLIVAGLFALHPLRVESVAWITERKDVLSTFFGLLALWVYARYAEKSKAHGAGSKLYYGLTLLFYAFGLMSKSMLVTFPCLLLLLDYWPLERWRQKSIWNLLIEKVPFLLLVVPVSIVTCYAQKAGGMFMLHFPLGFRLETALVAYARYLEKMFWPANLSMLYPYPDFWPVSQLLCATLLFFGISAPAFLLWRQRPYLLVGWLWYLGTLLPVIGFIPLWVQSMSNHYTYISMIGILLLLVWGIDELTKRWRHQAVFITTVVLLILSVCIMRTRDEIVYWKDGVALWSRAIAVTGKNFMAHYCLAEILSSTNPDEALAEYQKSVAIYPDFALAQLGLAWILNSEHRPSEAVVHLEKVAQLEPQNNLAQDGLGELLFQMDRVSDAIPHLLKAIETDPQTTRFKDVLVSDFSSVDHGTEAVNSFLATMQSDPAGFDRFYEALQFDTNRVGLINNLAWAFATNPDPKLRNGEYAVRLATRACEMTGFETPTCVGTLGAAYAEDSRFDEAIATAQKACSMASAARQTDLLKKNQNLLKMFRSHQPYHEPDKASSP